YTLIDGVHELRTRVEELTDARDRLLDALKDIAGQRTVADIIRQDGMEAIEHCDFEGAWDIVIIKARDVLARTRKDTP
ncbi:MAG: hypothetical protein P1V36_17960, partial [Planctomycetota bacterium]|nr:hypothetical protein [Planctomycetota bacterium]